MACGDGNVPVVQCLCGSKANVHAAEGHCGETSLHWAAAKGHVNVVSILLEARVDAHALDKSGRTCLHKAAEFGQVAVVALLFEDANEEPNACDHTGRTSLHFAAKCGHADVVAMLLRAKADAAAGDQNHETPLHCAAAQGHADVVKALLDAKADAKACNSKSIDAVKLAIEHHRAGVIQVLCRAGFWDLSLLASLIRAEGPDAKEALDAWMHPAKTRARAKMELHGLDRAHLRERLRVVLAPEDANRPGQGILRVCESYANLQSQNLFTAPKVQVSLSVVPGLVASDACREELLAALEETANENVFQTDVVEAVVSAAWMQLRFSTAFEIFVSLVTIVLLCHSSYAFRHGHPEAVASLVLIGVLHMQKSIEEFCQYVTMCWKLRLRLLNFDNGADMSYIIIGWGAILRQALDQNRLEKPFMAIFSAMAWLRALYTLRGESWMGPRLLPILSALKDTLAFFIVTGTCILAATHAYYNLQLREEPIPTYGAFLQVMRLGIFGDFDLFEFEGVDPTYKLGEGEEWEPQDPEPGATFVWAHALFYFTGIGIAILLMNLLIGVLGQNFELYQDQSAMLFQRARAKMLLELQARPWRHCGSWFIKHLRELTSQMRKSQFGCVLYWLCVGALVMLLLPCWLALGSCVAAVAVLCRIIFQMQLSGMFYSVAVPLGYCGSGYDDNSNHKIDEYSSPEKSKIWVVLRWEAPMEELRSLRSEVKIHVKSMQGELEKKLQGVDEKLKGVENTLQDLSSAQKEMEKSLEQLTNEQNCPNFDMESKMETLTSLVRQLILQGQSVPETESHPEG
ncbi:Putative ankyrin repeat protein RF_0381 [Durusdinium trenchii]